MTLPRDTGPYEPSFSSLLRRADLTVPGRIPASAADVVQWLRRCPLGDEALFEALGSRDRTWLNEFMVRASLSERSRYSLLQLFVRRLEAEVDATPELVERCLTHHLRLVTNAKEPSEVIIKRLRDDPVAAMALPHFRPRTSNLVRLGSGGYWHEDGSYRYHDVQHAGVKVISAAVEGGYIDRRTLIEDLHQGLHSDERYQAECVSLMQQIAPTAEEIAPSLEQWVRLSTTIPCMDKGVLSRSVAVLAGQGRLPDEQVARWLHVLREETADLAANALTALTVLSDDPRYVRDEDAAEILRFATDGAATKATAAMACVQSLYKAHRLTDQQIIECAPTVLFRPQRRLVNAMIRLLGQTLRDAPDRAPVLVPVLADAFAHPSPDTQERALNLACHYGDRLDAKARARLAEAAAHMIPALRERAVTAFGRSSVEASDGEPTVYQETLPTLAGPQRLAPPTEELGEVLPELAVWLRGRQREPARWERALDDLVRHAYQDREALAEALAPVLKTVDNSSPTPQVDVVMALSPTYTPPPYMRDMGELEKYLHYYTHSGCGREVLDRAIRARMYELWRRITQHDVPPFLLATPTWADGTIAPGDLVDRLAAYEALSARPGVADLDQALLRVRHDDTAATAADHADGLGSPEAARLASWLRCGGLTPPGTTRRHFGNHPAKDGCRPDPVQYRLRAEIGRTATVPAGFSKPFRRLLNPFVVPRDKCQWAADPQSWTAGSLPLLLTVLPVHREIVAARTLTAFADAAETADPSAAEHLPVLVDTDAPSGVAVHLALAYGLGAGRLAERVAAADALLIMAARGSLDVDRLGQYLCDLMTHGALKSGRVAETLTVAAQSGACLTVGAVLAAVLPPLLPEPGRLAPTGLDQLLTLAADCAETTQRTPPVEGIAELAARKGSSLFLKSARRLHAACAPPT
ncbi:DUF7824 domain-containing protein [Streptomyces sp. NPDC001288]|uniref:DUF7824 domain-containing protein n=1 Tax=Streptomyces sp. NPDC001297 TaxID=3364559 RepID=UPI0036CC12B9